MGPTAKNRVSVARFHRSVARIVSLRFGETMMQSHQEYEEFAREVTVGSPWGNAHARFLQNCPQYAIYFGEDNEHNLENFGRVLVATSSFPASPSALEFAMEALLKKGEIKLPNGRAGKPYVAPPPPIPEPDREFWNVVSSLDQEYLNDIYAGKAAEPINDFKRRYDKACSENPGLKRPTKTKRDGSVVEIPDDSGLPADLIQARLAYLQLSAETVRRRYKTSAAFRNRLQALIDARLV